MITTLFVDRQVSAQCLTSADINSVAIVRLPFRLRVGSFWRLPYDSNTEMCFRNQVEITEGSRQMVLRSMSSYESLFTDLIIIKRNLPLDTADVNQVASAMQSPNDTPPDLSKDYFSFLGGLSEILNDFLVAYNHATNEFLCGRPLFRFTDIDISNHLPWHVTLVSPASERVSEHTILELFTRHPVVHPERADTLTFGECHKLPEETLNRIPLAMDMKRRFIFCDFAFDAKIYMSGRQAIQGLLHAVIAFEGVHAAFLRLALTEKLKSTCNAVPEKRVNELVENLLKEAGLSAIHHLTPLLFMEPDERPSLDENDACQLGITIRNEVMHSLMKRGKYKLRNRTDIDITNAYKSVLKVYQKYLNAFESRLRSLHSIETEFEQPQ